MPSAVTISTERRLSQLRPWARIIAPRPPPRVSPATPVTDTSPPGVASPWTWVARSTSPQVAPACTWAVRAVASTCTARIADRSMTRPSSHTALPATWWPPPRMLTHRTVVAGDPYRLDDVGHVRAAGDHGGVSIDEPVPDPAGLVVAGMVAVDDLAAQAGDAARRSSPARPAMSSCSCLGLVSCGHCRPAPLHGTCTRLHERMTACDSSRSDESPALPVRISVLGPLRMTVGDDVVEVPGPKRRGLARAARHGRGPRRRQPSDLLDALWPAELPDSARATLQSHVSRLRRHLGPAARRSKARAAPTACASTSGAEPTSPAPARCSPPQAARLRRRHALPCWPRPGRCWRGVAARRVRRRGSAGCVRAVSLDAFRRAVDEAYVAAAIAAGDTGAAVEVALRARRRTTRCRKPPCCC